LGTKQSKGALNLRQAEELTLLSITWSWQRI